MRVIYVALDPLKYPRIRKIAHSLRKCKYVKFGIMIPWFRFVYRGSRFGRFFFAFLNYFALFFQIFLARADFFWVANCPDVLVFPLILRRKRYILEYRSPWTIEVAQEFGRGPWVSLASIFERLALNHAWIVTLTTSRLLGRIKDYGKITFVIPNYPLESFGNNVIPKEDFRRRYGYSVNDKVVLFVGKLTRVEGADLLPKIIENVFRNNTSVIFWIVGDGPFYETLKALEEKYPKRVKLFGWQPQSIIPSIIDASDVCIIPRHKSPFAGYYNEEGVSKLSEYMFFEKPIIACNIAESDEYLLVGEDEMADGILKALRGEVPKPKRRTWEDYSEKKIVKLFEMISFGMI